MDKPLLLVFSGAGVSAESGIPTFRDFKTGLWHNVDVSEVATPQGWRANKEKVLNFYNERRAQLKTVVPNKAHEIIAQLEEYFNVVIVTQNVDDLHERAGSTNVIHLHGELLKARSTLDKALVYEWKEDIKIGDKCEKGSQLRPHIVWFGEDLPDNEFNSAKLIAQSCDVCIIIGTSLNVAPACTIPFESDEETTIYYVDPTDEEADISYYRIPYFTHVKEKASIGMENVKRLLISRFSL